MIRPTVAWEPANYIALVAVFVSPLAALGGAWLNSYLSRRAKADEQAEIFRKENAQAIAPMFGVLVDALPSLIIGSQLREYDSPRAAIEGLYGRWAVAREPLLVMHYAHPSENVRRLAFDFQAKVEMSLRQTDNWIQRNTDTDSSPDTSQPKVADSIHREAGQIAMELARAIQGSSAQA